MDNQPIITKPKEHTHTHTQRQNSPKKTKYKTVTWQAKKAKNDINQLKTKLTKTPTRKQDQRRLPTRE